MTTSDWINLTTILSNLAAVIAILLALWFGKRQLDDLKVTRHGEMIKTIFEMWNTSEMHAAYTHTQRMEFKDWKDFKEHNPADSTEWWLWIRTMNFFNTIGVLVKTRALDAEVAHTMLKALPRLWDRIQPLVIGYRLDFASPHFCEEFEWLYREVIKRQTKE